MELSEAILQKLPYWEKLTNEEKRLLAANCTVRQYRKGEIVHGGNYECLGQIFVLSGEIRTYLLSEEGREVTLFMLREGNPCVLSASCILSQITFETQMKAMKTTDLLIIHLGAFQRIINQNIYVRCFMFELATERFSQVMWSMQQILFMGFDRRLASYLLGEYERTGSKYIRMTHEQIAEQVSSAREVVARMLKRFAADGLIEAERGTIRLISLDGLRRLI